jgi:DNA repair protein RecO (recombination protein O)
LKQRSDEAYVLRTQELGETDLIVSLLAEQYGQVRGVARAARKSRKRFGGALEPLTRVRAAWSEKQGRDLHRIETIDAVRSFAIMQSDPTVQAACAVLAEICTVFAHEGQADPRGFKLLGAVLEALEGGADPVTAVRYFEYWTLRLHGLLPDLAACAICSSPLEPGQPAKVVRRQGVLCRSCLVASGEPGRRLSDEALRFLDAARRLPPAGLPSQGQAVRCGGALESLLRGTLERFAERGFRTYRHLEGAVRADTGREAQP